jgi:hypothetical protein
MGSLHIKPGVILDRLNLAGRAIAGAVLITAAGLPFDLTITSGQEGEHTGLAHRLGNAVDVRSHDVPPESKSSVLQLLMSDLCALERRLGVNSLVEPKDGGFVTECFYGFLEHPGEPREHYHLQLRIGHVFPPTGEN